MAYLSGTATSLIDLLTTIKTFLTDNGWTLDGFADSLTGARGETQAAGKELHVHNGSAYFSLKTCDNIRPFYGTTAMSGLGVTGSTGYDALKTGQDWAKQPGYPVDLDSVCNNEPVGAVIRVADGSFTYHMILVSDTFICCFEYATGEYKWLAFGTLEKLGTYTGGYFFAASDHSLTDGIYLNNSFMRAAMTYRTLTGNVYTNTGLNSAVYIDSGPDGTGWYVNGGRSTYDRDEEDNKIANFHGVCSADATADGNGEADRSMAFAIYKCGYNSLTARRPQMPILVTVYDAVPGKYRPIGYVPGLRVLNMQNMLPADEITIGSDVWKIFPNYKQSGSDLDNVGLAIKKA